VPYAEACLSCPNWDAQGRCKLFVKWEKSITGNTDDSVICPFYFEQNGKNFFSFSSAVDCSGKCHHNAGGTVYFHCASNANGFVISDFCYNEANILNNLNWGFSAETEDTE
jgi:hypothetical protein